MKNNKKIFLIVLFSLFFSSSIFSATKNIQSIFNDGVQAQEEQNLYLACQYFLEVVNENPSYTEAWFKLAECSYKLSEFDLALQYLENAEKFEKNSSKIQNLKGMIYLALGKVNEGKEIFQNILKNIPNDIDAHFGLAEIELLEGKFSGAEKQYLEALKRHSSNRKALLSLALVCAHIKRFTDAKDFIRKALSYYSGDCEVHYLASIIYYMQNDLKNAEKQARISVELNGDYDKAYHLLAMILFNQNRNNEVIDICDFVISRNRNNSNAWYMKGVALSKMGDTHGAIQTWSTGLSIQPNDEIMRFAMELEVKNVLSVEDYRRNEWAEYHIQNAKQYESKYDGIGASYEYQRALQLSPMNVTARLAYAELLQLNSMHELYLEQLLFVKENLDNKSSVNKKQLDDKIEAYESLLEKTIAKKWNIEPFYLDKTRWNIAIFYENDNSNFIHADTNRLVAKAASDIFNGIAITSVKTQVTPISGYGEAFKNARTNNFDYFVIISMNEGSNDITLKSTLYSGRTGLEISKDTFYTTGNNRFSTVLRRFRASILEKLSVKGKIIAREGKTVLLDLGKSENVVADCKFKIVKKGQVKTSDSSSGLLYKDDDVLGVVVITNAGEEVSEGIIESHGFYDKINIDDEVVLVEMPQTNDNSSTVVDNVPAADDKGNVVVKNSVDSGDAMLAEIKKIVDQPSIIELIHDIY